MTKPLVSVIMAAYNAESYLAQAVDSILAQTFTDFEFIIIDDCSTDSTPQLLAGYAARDQRIVLLTNEQNLGLADSLNRGLAAARGQYIARIDADDISNPDRLRVQVARLRQDSSVKLLGTAYHVIDEQNHILETLVHPQNNLSIQWLALFYSPFCHSSVMLQSAVLGQCGAYNGDFRAEDYDLWDRILQEHQGANLPRPLVSWRQSPGQISIQKQDKLQNSVVQISQRAILRLLGRDDFLTLEETAQLRQWYYAQLPERPTLADFVLADKWLHIWVAFVTKHQPTRTEQLPLLYNLIRALLIMVWTWQPGAGRLFGQLLRLAPLQVGRAIFINNARRIKRRFIK